MTQLKSGHRVDSSVADNIYLLVGSLACGALVWAGLHALEIPKSGASEPSALVTLREMAAVGAGILFFFVGQILVSRRRRERVGANVHDLVRVMADGFVVIDEHGLMEEANETVEDIFGYSRAELIGRNVSLLMPEHDARRHDGHLARYLETGESKILRIGPREVVGLTKRGVRIPLELAVSEVYLGRRRVFAGCLRDISQRKELERQRQILTDVVETAALPTAVLEGTAPEDLLYVYCNGAFAGLYDVDPGEITSTKMLDWAARTVNKRASDEESRLKLLESIRARRAFSDIVKVRVRGGNFEFRKLQMLPISGRSPDSMRWLMVSSDLTETRRRDLALQRAHEVARMGTWELDVNSGQVVWSDEVFRIYGVNSETFVPSVHNINALVHPNDHAARLAWLANAFQSGQRGEFNYRIIRPDGEVRFVKADIQADFDDAGKTVRRFGTLRDVTEEHRQVEALRLRDRAIDATNSSIVIKEYNAKSDVWQIVSINPAFEALSGYSRDEAIGATASTLLGIRDLNPNTWQEHIDQLRMTNSSGGELRMRRKGGAVIDVEVNMSYVLGEDAKPKYLVIISNDITERKQRDKKSAQAEKMRAMGLLTSTVAHDFSNFLTVISGNIELLIQRGLSDDQKVLGDRALRGCSQAAALTKSLRAFSRQQNVLPQVCDVVRVVGDLRDFLDVIFPNDIRFDVICAVPTANILADLGALESCLLNLAVNARDAMADGGRLTFVVAGEDALPVNNGDVSAAPARGYVRISVVDTGHGMPEHVRLRALEPFFTTKPLGSGTGLGLSTANGFANQLGGTLTIESVENVGTTISMYLPLVPD